MKGGHPLPLLGQIRTRVASVPDQRHVVWELWVDDDKIADVRYEGGETRVEVFRPVGGKEFRVSLDGFLAALTLARDDFARLAGR